MSWHFMEQCRGCVFFRDGQCHSDFFDDIDEGDCRHRIVEGDVTEI